MIKLLTICFPKMASSFSSKIALFSNASFLFLSLSFSFYKKNDILIENIYTVFIVYEKSLFFLVYISHTLWSGFLAPVPIVVYNKKNKYHVLCWSNLKIKINFERERESQYTLAFFNSMLNSVLLKTHPSNLQRRLKNLASFLKPGNWTNNIRLTLLLPCLRNFHPWYMYSVIIDCTFW